MIDNSSKSSGNTSWLGGSTNLQYIWDLRGERSLSAHDVAHRLVLTAVWQLPFGRDRKWGSGWNRLADLVLGGWDVSAVFARQSGMPLAVTQSGGVIWDGTQRPSLVGDPRTSGPITGRLDNYFNPDACCRSSGTPTRPTPSRCSRTTRCSWSLRSWRSSPPFSSGCCPPGRPVARIPRPC